MVTLNEGDGGVELIKRRAARKERNVRTAAGSVISSSAAVVDLDVEELHSSGGGLRRP